MAGPLTTTYADGSSTVHDTDVNSWTTMINALKDLAIEAGYTVASGYATTVTSGSTVTLVYTSPGIQAFTGSTAQTVSLPTTSVTAGMLWWIVNNSSATVTVNASGGATVGTVAAGSVGKFAAVSSTPTTAAGWTTTPQKTFINPLIEGYSESIQALGTVTTTSTIGPVTSGTVVTATLTASTACTFTMPSVVSGVSQSFVMQVKQASGGSGTATFTGVKWPGGTAPTITATASAVDTLTFFNFGVSTWYGTYAQAFA